MSVITIKHNVTTWGVTLTWFKAWENNLQRTFRVPDSYRQTWTINGTFQEEAAYNAIANKYISAAVADTQNVLNELRFDWLKENPTKEGLREMIGYAIIHATQNRRIFQMVNQSSFSTPNFQINADTDDTLISRDIWGTNSRIAYKNSNIRKYKFIYEGQANALIQDQQTGSIEILGAIDETKIPELF